jgi:hypothetical protein
MRNETPLRFGDASDTGNGGGGGIGEPTPLQARAAFLANWHWQSVVRLNERLCSGGRAQHGKNSEAHGPCEQEWKTSHASERTVVEALDWLRSFHRKAPFLFFNGNTFAEIARTFTDALFAEFPTARRREAASLAAHYVAGVLDREALMAGIVALAEFGEFAVGDRVRTLKGSARGVVRKIRPDGRIVWKPDGASAEMTGLPESLLREKKKR